MTLIRVEIVRYFAASMIALMLDMAIFVIGIRVLGLPWWISAVLGFSAGVLLAYLLSIYSVFGVRRLKHQPRREFLLFLLVGILGLGVTQLTLLLFIEHGKLGAEVSRFMSAGITFLFNFFVRKAVIFSRLARLSR